MLQSIRDRAQGMMAWIILILICVPFAFWGMENYIGGGRERPVAVVGDAEIFQADLAKAYQEMAARLGGFAQIDEATLKQLALKNLIDEQVLRQYAFDRGFMVSDGQIRDTIRTLPYFQGEKGFDKEKYDGILKAQNIAEPSFVEQIRNEMEIAQLQDGIIRSTFATGPEIERFLNLRDQSRTVEYVTIPVSESDSEISPEVIETYYRENEASFRFPEQVAVQYIELNLEEIAAKLDLTEDEFRTFYESQQDVYTRKERRRISHILAAVDVKDSAKGDQAALDKIKQAQAMLYKGEEFAVVAEKLSDDPVSAKQGGDIGLINPGDMDPAFEKAAFALDVGRVSAPVRTPFGYHLIKLTELEPGEVKSFETVRGDVEKALRRQKAENTFYELGERLARITYENPDSLVLAAESTGFETKTSDLFTRQEKEGFGADRKIADAAFSDQVLEGKNSDPVELSVDRVMFLRLEKHVPASTKPLDDVRDQVIHQIRTQHASEEARKLADRVLAELKAGRSLADLAESNKLEVIRPEPVDRSESKLPRDLVTALFSAEKPVNAQPVPFQAALADGTQVVAVLLDVQGKSGSQQEGKEKESDQAGQWLGSHYANAEFSDMLAQLKQDAQVTVFEKED